MKKNGFTLIELLAVIVILAILALIITPIVSNIINKSKESADMRSAEGYVKAAEHYYASSIIDETKRVTLDNKTNVIDLLTINGKNATLGNITIDDKGYVTMNIVINNKCYSKSGIQNIKEISVSDDADSCVPPYKEELLNGADPVLSDGMIPIIINDNGDVIKANIRDEWYKYETNKWANMILVNEESRDNYKNAKYGMPINNSDILGFFVWIPRYKYQLFSGGVQKINIAFENKDTIKSTGNVSGDWLTHPAFTFGDKELNGLWVAKYETTGNADTPTVKPNEVSLKQQNVSPQFITSQKLNNITKYGINNDSHMAKNSEWGAISYLSQSIYGRCANDICNEISINNSSSFITGSSAGNPNGGSNVYAYNTKEGYMASTTGNITGIYDMSGGSFEYVMGNFNYSMGLSNFGSLPDPKYYQIYTANQNILGDAIFETRGWYGDYDSYATSSDGWFMRGGQFSGGAAAGIFSYDHTEGDWYRNISFRIILAP